MPLIVLVLGVAVIYFALKTNAAHESRASDTATSNGSSTSGLFVNEKQMLPANSAIPFLGGVKAPSPATSAGSPTASAFYSGQLAVAYQQVGDGSAKVGVMPITVYSGSVITGASQYAHRNKSLKTERDANASGNGPQGAGTVKV